MTLLQGISAKLISFKIFPMRAFLVVLFMVCFYLGGAQTYFRSPLYSFTGRVAIGTGNTPDSSAYLTVGPLGASTKGLRLPRVSDRASITGTKRNGLMIYSAQKAGPAWYDSASVAWRAFGGETNTMSSAGGTSLYKSKTGVNFDLKGITAGSGVLVTAGTNDVVLKADTSLLATLTDLSSTFYANQYAPPIRVVNDADITVLSTDYTLIEKGNASGRNITLLAASSYPNRVFMIVAAGAGSLTTSVAMRMTASSTRTLIQPNESFIIQSDGTDWWIISISTRS